MWGSENYLFLLYYIRSIVFLSLVPVDHEWNKEDDATGEKDNTAAETQYIIVSETLRDEEEGADKKQKPAREVITFLLFTD